MVGLIMIYTFFLIFILFLNLLLGFFVLLKNHKNPINLSFFLFVLFVTFWMFVNYMSNQFTGYQQAFFWNKMIFVISPYISYTLLYFSAVFPSTIIPVKKSLLFLLLVPILISNVLTITNITITGITFLPNGVTGVE